MTTQAEERVSQNQILADELQNLRNQVIDLKKKLDTAPTTARVEKQTEEEQVEEKDRESTFPIQLYEKIEGELGLISTVLGCRANRDRIEFSYDLKEFVQREQAKEKGDGTAGLGSNYVLKLSNDLMDFVNKTTPAELARKMPKYDFISPSLALIIMNEIRRMLLDPEIIEILSEKD